MYSNKNSDILISQSKLFATGRALAKRCGSTYYEDLKSKDIVIRVYAGGF